MAKYKAKVNTKEVENNKTNKKNNAKVEKKSAETKKKEKQINKAIKQGAILTDTQIQIRNFVIILVVLVVIVIGLVFLSNYIVDKRENETSNTTKEVEINYDIANVGMILNRPYDEYYVMVYDSSDKDAVYYATLISSYEGKENALKIYFTDLNLSVNKAYKSNNETGNSDVTNNVDDFSFGKVTLLKVRGGNVVNYYEAIEDIESILK